MPRLTAAEIRGDAEFEFELRPGQMVLLRRASMATLLFAGQIPLPLTQTLSRLHEDTTGLELMGWPAEDREALLEALRFYCCAVVVDPVVVREPDGDPTHVAVELFSLEELFAILNAAPPIPSVMAPRLSEADAARFRRDAATAADPAAPIGEDVPAPPVRVGAADVPVVHS